MKKIFIPLLYLSILMGLVSCSWIGGDSSTETRIIDFRNKIDGNSTYHNRSADNDSPSSRIVSEPSSINGNELLNLTVEECKNIFVFEPDDQGIKVTYNPPKKILYDIRYNRAGYDTLTLTYVDENWNLLTKQSLSGDVYNASFDEGWHDESKTWIYPLVAPNEKIKLFAQVIVHKAGKRAYYYQAFYDVTAGNGGIGHVDSLEEKWEKKAKLNIGTANARKYVLKNVIPPEADEVRKHFVLWTDRSSTMNYDTAKYISEDYQELSEGDSITYDITTSPFLKTTVLTEPYLFYIFSYLYRYDAYPDLIFETPAIQSENIANTYLSLSPKDREKGNSETIPLQSSSLNNLGVNTMQMGGLKDYEDYVFVAELEYTPSYETSGFIFQYAPDPEPKAYTKGFTRSMEAGKYYFKVKVSDFYDSKWDSDHIVYGGIGSVVLKKAYLIKSQSLIVTLNPAGGKIDKTTVDIFPIGCNYDEKIPEPQKEGFYFDGWYLDKAYTSKFTGETFGNKVLYAKWSDKKHLDFGPINDPYFEYAVVFHNLERYKDEIIVIKIQNTSKQDNFILCNPIFSPADNCKRICKPGEILTLHCKGQDLFNEIGYTSLVISANNPFTVADAYIALDKSYSVTLNKENGEASEKIVAKTGTEISSFPIPVNSNGLIFAGWYKDSALTQPVSDSDIVENDITLYAKWSEKFEIKKFMYNEDLAYHQVSWSFNIEPYKNVENAILSIHFKNTSEFVHHFNIRFDGDSTFMYEPLEPGESKNVQIKVSELYASKITNEEKNVIIDGQYFEVEKIELFIMK